MLGAALPRLDEAARTITDEGRPVEHLGSYLVPRDEVVFSVIRAASEAVVREVNERAGVPFDRIAEVTSHGFVHQPDGAVAAIDAGAGREEA